MWATFLCFYWSFIQLRCTSTAHVKAWGCSLCTKRIFCMQRWPRYWFLFSSGGTRYLDLYLSRNTQGVRYVSHNLWTVVVIQFVNSFDECVFTQMVDLGLMSMVFVFCRINGTITSNGTVVAAPPGQFSPNAGTAGFEPQYLGVSAAVMLMTYLLTWQAKPKHLLSHPVLILAYRTHGYF